MTSNRISPARRAVLERRAAAARRRAVLTFSLFLVTIVVAVIGFNTSLSAWFALVPAALMGSVLVLGRKAVIANQRNDAAYAARQDQVTYAPRQMSATERRLAGRPVPAVRTGIPTAHAENVSTTVMARVESSMFAKKHITGSAVSPNVAAKAERSQDLASSASSAATAIAQATSPAPQVSMPAASSASEQLRAPKPAVKPVPAPPAHQPSQKQWSSVAVPAPVYASKAAAPQWEPPGVTTELRKVTAQRMEQIAREAELRANDATPVVTETEQPSESSESAAAETAVAQAGTPDSLGVNLNSILARRRAV